MILLLSYTASIYLSMPTCLSRNVLYSFLCLWPSSFIYSFPQGGLLLATSLSFSSSENIWLHLHLKSTFLLVGEFYLLPWLVLLFQTLFHFPAGLTLSPLKPQRSLSHPFEDQYPHHPGCLQTYLCFWVLAVKNNVMPGFELLFFLKNLIPLGMY